MKKYGNLRYEEDSQYNTQIEAKSKGDYLSEFFSRLQVAYSTTKQEFVRTDFDNSNKNSHNDKLLNLKTLISDLNMPNGKEQEENMLNNKEESLLKENQNEGIIKNVKFGEDNLNNINLINRNEGDVILNKSGQDLRENVMSNNTSIMHHDLLFNNMNDNFTSMMKVNDNFDYDVDFLTPLENKQTIEIDNRINLDEQILIRKETKENKGKEPNLKVNKLETPVVGNLPYKRKSLSKFLNVNQSDKKKINLDVSASTRSESKKTVSKSKLNCTPTSKSKNLSSNECEKSFKRSISTKSSVKPKINDVINCISLPGAELLLDLEEIFGTNLEHFDEDLLYNTLEDFNLKMLIRSLIFLAFEQKKKINELITTNSSKVSYGSGSKTLRLQNKSADKSPRIIDKPKDLFNDRKSSFNKNESSNVEKSKIESKVNGFSQNNKSIKENLISIVGRRTVGNEIKDLRQKETSRNKIETIKSVNQSKSPAPKQHVKTNSITNSANIQTNKYVNKNLPPVNKSPIRKI